MTIDMQRIREAQAAFHDYHHYQSWFYGYRYDDLCLVAIRRIDQTILLLDKINLQLEQRTSIDYELKWLSETEIYVEAFYWFAFSAGRALHFHWEDVHEKGLSKAKGLPEPRFRNFFKEAIGVCIVRNKLIEHFEKRDGVRSGWLKVLDSGDLIVQYEEPWVSSLLRRPHSDPGLYANVDEFFNKLRRCSELSSEPLVAAGAKISRST